MEEEISSINSYPRVDEELDQPVVETPVVSSVESTPVQSTLEPELEDDSKVNGMTKEQVKIYLNEVHELFSDYIGIAISGFDSFNDSVENLERKIGPFKGMITMISSVEVDGKHVWVRLHNFDGKHGGYIKISPSPTAQFSEKQSSSEPGKSAAYRIKFVGDDCIEYVDQDGKGEVSFFAGYR